MVENFTILGIQLQTWMLIALVVAAVVFMVFSKRPPQQFERAAFGGCNVDLTAKGGRA